MNRNILDTDTQQFILDNLYTKVTKLALKGSPFLNISIQELANQIVAKQKAELKLPTWFNTKNIYYPPKISIEQTSSEITADYKAKLIKGNSIIDITGGFGIDAYYFSKYFNKVVHCEINKELSEIVKYNYEQLNVSNIITIADDGLDFLKKTNEKFDCIYIDPSRRSDVKGKVFLLKDCLPNVPENLDFLFSKTDTILIKNSPILDISSTINELNYVKEVHIVGLKNEVKELLFLLEKGYTSAIKIKTINFLKNKDQKFDFEYRSEAFSEYSDPLTYLYEPNSAILKSGGFHQISTELNIKKLHQHSHLYTSETLIDFPGRRFKIEKVLIYDKKQLNKYLPEKKANITVRNFPKSVEQIRKETKIKDGGDHYLFFTKLQNEKNHIIICKQIYN
ncbi:putative methyltransferase [Tenacibaculum adriaticum]|uniref:Putative methyltransferase n=1 Tax=Tenacibaculum adriaticum TaxID=413713 RepID=A0A5S5DTS2_9FLAO|nr:RsmD family RNA methyltransferase [Tenacibaculum adriaticum]TYP99064.1 putative methyltransferase [Tenacibaculum adriaticum]